MATAFSRSLAKNPDSAHRGQKKAKQKRQLVTWPDFDSGKSARRWVGERETSTSFTEDGAAFS
jgi:hypothetical protein